MAKKEEKVKEKISGIAPTDERIVSRGGLIFFIKYLSNIGVYSLLERKFGSLRKNKKGKSIESIFKQLFCYFIDGSKFTLTRFDELKEDMSYAGLIEESESGLLSSHSMKRFFNKFYIVRVWLFRQVLQKLFIWRLCLEKPEIIILSIDVMPMNNDDANKREGVEMTYKKVKGFAPLQMSWGRYIIDAVFRGGSKHSNHGDTVEKMVKHIVKKIRNNYRIDIPILIRVDSGYFDQELMKLFDQLKVGFIVGGKLYKDIKKTVSSLDEEYWQTYENKRQIWNYAELGDRRKSWDKFYRMLYCRPLLEDGQVLMEFARPDTVMYTNLGVNSSVTDIFKEAGQERFLESEIIIETFHGRGEDELVHRALKELGTETLPFERFESNAAFYYIMLVAFFLFETFKEDVLEDVIPIGSYANTVRRTIIDVGAKIVSHSGQTVIKFFRTLYRQIRCDMLWERALSPPLLTVTQQIKI